MVNPKNHQIKIALGMDAYRKARNVSIKTLARELNLSEPTTSARLKNPGTFTVAQFVKVSTLLETDPLEWLKS